MQQHHQRPNSELGGVVVLDFGAKYATNRPARIANNKSSPRCSHAPPAPTNPQVEPSGIVLSGAQLRLDPQARSASKCPPLGIPVLGIC